MIEQLEQHEAFLRAIFDAPADDTPRLVYADFLEENGLADRAELIRTQIELARLFARGESAGDHVDRLRRQEDDAYRHVYEGLVPAYYPRPRYLARGLWHTRSSPDAGIPIAADHLADPDEFRRRVVADDPACYGLSRLWATPARPLGPDEVNTLFDLPFTQQVTDWDLGGHVEEVPGGGADDAGTFSLIDMIERPVITLGGVEALAAHRGARRIRALVLTHNGLGNDAVRALARSSHLIRLERLDFRDGNSPKGRVWQELVARFGEQVVG